MKTLLIILIILLPALILAPIARLYKAHQPATSMPVDLAEYALPGLTYRGQFAAANQGPYQVSHFQHQHCDGAIALLPLYRNAEGSNVLIRLLNNTSLRYGVLFNGELHATFPQWSFTLYQFRHQLLKGTRLASPTIQPYAFAESGQCAIAESLLHTLSNSRHDSHIQTTSGQPLSAYKAWQTKTRSVHQKL